MRPFIKTILIALTALVYFTACREKDDIIIPSGDYSPIRGGFPQDTTEWDDILYNIKQEYGVYLLYKDVTEEDMNRTWVSDGTGPIIVAGKAEERKARRWDLPKEHLPFYVNFFNDYIFPNIGNEFAKSTFPIKIYMINNLRAEPRKFSDDSEEKENDSNAESGTDTNPNKIIHFGEFDSWVISFPDSVIEDNGENKSEELLRRLRCRFMTTVIKRSIEKKQIPIPKEFWDGYEFKKSSSCDQDYNHENCTMVDVVDKENPINGLYTLGYVDVMEDKFGTENNDTIFKNTNMFKGKAAHALNWNSTSNPTWNLFEAYVMNAMYFTPEEFHEYYNTNKYTTIKEKYDFVVKYMYTYDIDLVGIANGKKEKKEEQSQP